MQAALPVPASPALTAGVPSPQPRVPTGALQVLNLGQLQAAEQAQKDAIAQAQKVTPEEETGLTALVRREWEVMWRHRNSANGWSNRMLAALRQFNGQYDPSKLAEIQKFGGSTIYARLTAIKCRGATSLLRDVYLTTDQPWGLEAPADAEIPVEVFQNIVRLVQSEVQSQMQGIQTGEAPGPAPSKDDVRDRTNQLIEAARQAAKKKAADRVGIAEDKLETLLREGGWYDALSASLTDLTIFPFSCIKGPVVKMVPVVKWYNGTPYQDTVPKLFWNRVSPFDLWWTPGVSDIAAANVIERIRFSRADLNDLLDLPGYNTDAVKEILTSMPRGYSDTPDATDSSRAAMESRENPMWNESGLYDCLEYHGNVQGQVLLDAGMEKRLIPDPMRDYAVELWMIGSHLLKLQMAPSPRKRHPYFVTSFEKVPGTPVGNSLPDILADLQDFANATMRSAVNNMAMASGPQVVVMDDRLSGQENGEDMYPWKRWHVVSDPFGASSSSQKPVDFFQPQSNIQELMATFQQIMALADDWSAIPRYMQGTSPGAAGRTASGLAMLMGSSSKLLQTVCGNVDADQIKPSIEQLLDMVLLTDTTDLLDGTENVVVKGVAVALQRETQRSRQLEFLAATANPIDAQIMGPKGRGAVLRTVSKTLGMPGEQIVPTDDALDAQQKVAAAIATANGQPGHGGMGEQAAQAQGNQPGAPNRDTGPRTNLQQRQPGLTIGGGAG